MGDYINISVENLTSTSSKITVQTSYPFNYQRNLWFKSTLNHQNIVSFDYLYSLGTIELPPYTLSVPSDTNKYKLNNVDSTITLKNLPENTLIYIEYEVILPNNDSVFSYYSFTTSTGLSGGGAGSDPYITTFSGYTFELPHLNKNWNLFTHKSSDFSIIAHTHNYPTGNFFNEIKVKLGNLKATIDYQKQKITSNSLGNAFKVGKTQLKMKYNKQGKIIEEDKLFDCIVLNHPVFEEVVILVNWRNDYFHPMFKVKPTKDCSGLLMMKEPTKTL
jgi:hypothetical protein